jgi:hypothetical protein
VTSATALAILTAFDRIPALADAGDGTRASAAS